MNAKKHRNFNLMRGNGFSMGGYMQKFLTTILFLVISQNNLFAQWFWQNPLPQGNHLRDIQFIDENTGWVVGEFGYILKTTNEGLPSTTHFIRNWESPYLPMNIYVDQAD